MRSREHVMIELTISIIIIAIVSACIVRSECSGESVDHENCRISDLLGFGMSIDDAIKFNEEFIQLSKDLANFNSHQKESRDVYKY